MKAYSKSIVGPQQQILKLGSAYYAQIFAGYAQKITYYAQFLYSYYFKYANYFLKAYGRLEFIHSSCSWVYLTDYSIRMFHKMIVLLEYFSKPY